MSATYNNDDLHSLIQEVEREVLISQKEQQETNQAFLVSTKATLDVLAVLLDKVNELVDASNEAGTEINKIEVIDPEEGK